MLSAKMITHGRVHLLEEALHSFLLQDNAQDSELIIVNDCPAQTLIFNHPRVKIFNLEDIFETIGEKENFALEQCQGDTFITWDDDDIALVNHLDNVKKYFVPESNLLHWSKAVYYNEPNITAITGVGNSGIVYSRKAWLEIGKSPIENAGGDMTLVNKIRALDTTKVVHASPEHSDISWFYRWSTPHNYHQSGMGTDTPDRLNVVIRNAQYVKEQIDRGVFPKGNIYLKPCWRHDYTKMLKDYVTRTKI